MQHAVRLECGNGTNAKQRVHTTQASVTVFSRRLFRSDCMYRNAKDRLTAIKVIKVAVKVLVGAGVGQGAKPQRNDGTRRFSSTPAHRPTTSVFTRFLRRPHHGGQRAASAAYVREALCAVWAVAAHIPWQPAWPLADAGHEEQRDLFSSELVPLQEATMHLPSPASR